ncbi:MAG: hypothetical protein AAGH64_02625 [Planctomycetota bacterium]
MPRVLTITLLVLALLSGCARTVPSNPAFDLTIEDAEAELEAMGEDQRPLQRPLVVLAGFADPGVAVWGLVDRLKKTTSTPELVMSVTFFFEPSIQSARETAIARARERFGDVEVDVIGFSMGGLVARLSAVEIEGMQGPLDVNRLFTIGTPHRGAKAAVLPTFDQKVLAMRAGSPLLRRIDASLDDLGYEMLCYVRIGDGVVGHENASPVGWPVLWLPNEAYQFAHLGAGTDPRILADIARRLRDQPAYADTAGSPLPELE